MGGFRSRVILKKKFDYTFRALGSLFVVSFFRDDDSGLDAFVQKLRLSINDFEAEFSRFVPDSSLSLLNRIGSFDVSPRFVRLLEECRNVYVSSEGYFNPLFNVSRAGYSHDFESGVFEPSGSDEPYRTDFENVRISGSRVELSEGMRLDFGAIGKGFLADLSLPLFEEFGISDAILNYGGDTYVLGGGALGCFHRIGIMSPFPEGGIFATLDVSNLSVSSSGEYVRRWKNVSGEFSHIVFPSSIPSGDACASVTVVHEKGAVSDAFATALFSAGAERGLEIAMSARIDALFVKTDRTIVATPDFASKYGLRSA